MKNITVIGAGTMGNGIAHTFAQSGFKVNLIDVSKEALEKGVATISKNLDRLIKKEKITLADKEKTLNLISTFSSLEQAINKPDLVVEAATENVNLKLEIFTHLSKLTSKETILATNTSSISITKIAAVCKYPENVIGMHFMNPVPIMKLLEIIKGYNTSSQTTKKIIALSKKINKIPVEVNDYPGFIANRILMPMINEAILSLQEGVAGVVEIDQIMKLGMAHPMGPLQLADFIGLDVCLSILKVMYEGFGKEKYFPSTLLINMVTAKKLGIKSGEGFYNWEHETKDLIVAKQFC